jgi:5'-phosphate synthase pdxT subunit
MIKVGILGIQGDIEEHFFMTKKAMEKLGIKGKVIEVKESKDLEKISGLIIPGGESTVIGDFLKKENLTKGIKNLVNREGVVMGTCAGAILMAKECDDSQIELLNLMDISVNRNAYGRQKESFEINIEVEGMGNFNAVFIRAPVIEKVHGKAKVLAEFNEKPIFVQQKNLLALTFHPELTENTKIHEYFLKLNKT